MVVRYSYHQVSIIEVPMNEALIRQHVLDVLSETQQRLGCLPVDVDDSICPMQDIPQFCSLVALEATVALEGRLGRELGTDLFRDPARRSARTVGEIVQILSA